MIRQSRVASASRACRPGLWHFFGWLLVCGSVWTIGSAANAMSPVRLDEGVGDVVLAGKFEAFVDNGAQLTLADVQSPTNADRFAVTLNRRIDAQANEAIWLRIALRNTAPEAKHWWLDTGSLEVRNMDLYTPDASGVYQRQSASSMLPFSARPLPLKTIGFPVLLQSATDTVVYIRATALWQGVKIQPRVWEPSVLQANLRTERNHWMVYIGAASALILFNLLLSIVLRDRHYALYVLSSLAMLWCVSSWQGGFGAAFEMLWPNWPAFERFGRNTSGAAAVVTSAIFISSLLDLRNQVPRLFKALVVSTALYLTCAILLNTVGHFSSFNPGPASPTVAMIIGPLYNPSAELTMLLLGIAIVRLAWQGNRLARFLALATSPLLIGGLATNLSFTLTGHPLSAEVMLWASLFEMLMMALALADRFHQDRQEKLRAQRALVAGLQASEKVMEGKVVTRTQELSEALTQQQIAVAQNVSLIRQIEEKNLQLEAASQHKSDFLANMSHELRTPLNAIIGFSEVLREEMFGEVNAKQAEYLADIHSSGHHLLALINDILDLSKVEAGKMDLELSPLDMEAALADAMTLLRDRAMRNSVVLELECPAPIGTWITDVRKFKQIMVNLLSNAVKFTPGGGRVTVRAERIADEVRISVSDTGIGIKPDDQELVDEAFRQASGDHLKKSEGTGLGLALTRRFVELHGGELTLQSEAGRGSTFAFNLPYRELEPT